MAKIVGNLKPEDDYTHRLGPEPNFNESMYFNFFDPSRAIGGFVRLGNRANEGRAEMTVTLYLPDGRVLFTFQRPAISDNERFDAGGMRFEVLEPSEHLRTTFEGSVLDLREPRDMADPRRAFTENPTVALRLDLEHRAVGPMYGHSRSEDEESRDAEKQFAKAHYEQHMAVRGAIRLGEESFEIDGFGLRDHSWGPRHWQAIAGYEWLTMNFGPDLGVMISVIRREPGSEPSRNGVLLRDGEIEPLVWAEVEAESEAGTPYHRAVRARARTAAGEELSIDGRVRGFIPLRNRRHGVTTYIGEGMTEWRLGDRTGYGLSELLRTLD